MADKLTIDVLLAEISQEYKLPEALSEQALKDFKAKIKADIMFLQIHQFYMDDILTLEETKGEMRSILYKKFMDLLSQNNKTS